MPIISFAHEQLREEENSRSFEEIINFNWSSIIRRLRINTLQYYELQQLKMKEEKAVKQSLKPERTSIRLKKGPPNLCRYNSEGVDSISRGRLRHKVRWHVASHMKIGYNSARNVTYKFLIRRLKEQNKLRDLVNEMKGDNFNKTMIHSQRKNQKDQMGQDEEREMEEYLNWLKQKFRGEIQKQGEQVNLNNFSQNKKQNDERLKEEMQRRFLSLSPFKDQSWVFENLLRTYFKEDQGVQTSNDMKTGEQIERIHGSTKAYQNDIIDFFGQPVINNFSGRQEAYNANSYCLEKYS